MPREEQTGELYMIRGFANSRGDHLGSTVSIDVYRVCVIKSLEIITHTYTHLSKRKKISLPNFLKLGNTCG